MPYPKKDKLTTKPITDGRAKRLISLRRHFTVGFDWFYVDSVLLRAALWAATAEGAAVMLSTAAGGRGVCLKIFVGEDKIVEYATDAEELNGLLEAAASQLGETSVDYVELLKGQGKQPLTYADLPQAESVRAALLEEAKAEASKGVEATIVAD